MNLLRKQPTAAEQLRAQDRQLRHAATDLERERGALERQERQLKAEIKKAVQQGDDRGARSLAKAVLRNRAQRDQLLQAKATVASVQARAHGAAASQRVAQAVGTAAQVMGAANQRTDASGVRRVAAEFQWQAAAMDHVDALLADGLDSALDGDDIDDEVEAAMDQVLDELGLNLTAQVGPIPSSSLRAAEDPEADPAVADLAARLQRLRAAT